MKNSFVSEPWFSEVHPDRNELVFENRHKSYGAYQIRREYDNAIIFAFLIAAGTVLISASIPSIIRYFSPPEESIIAKDDTQITVELFQPPVISVPVEPPAKRSVQDVIQKKVNPFTAPVITDKDVIDADPIDLNASGHKIEGDPKATGVLTEPVINLNGTEPVPATSSNTVIFQADVMPSFEGGSSAMSKWIASHIRYHQSAKDASIEGTVYIGFVVDKLGNVVDARILKGIKGGSLLDEEALRVVKAMPRWNPGINNGHLVNVSLTVPITFMLK